MPQIILITIGLIILPLFLEKVWGKYSARRDRWLIWLALAIAVSAIATIELFALEGRWGNFFEHSLGGGVPSFLLFEYLRRSFQLRLNWLQYLTLLFFFVSGTGAINELAEFFLDQTTDRAYSTDRWDTWYDTLANSLGALLAWIVWQLTPAARRIK